MNLAASTPVVLQGGTLYALNMLDQVGAIDVPAGYTGKLAAGPLQEGARMFVIPTLTGSGTLRITSDDSALIAAHTTVPTDAANWEGMCTAFVGIAYGGHINDGNSVDTNASAFTGDIDIAPGAAMFADDQTAYGGANDAQALWPTHAKSLVVEAGGWFLVGDYDTWGNLSITGQNVRGNGNICMNTSGFGVLATSAATCDHGGTLTINNAQVSPGLQSGVGKLTVFGNTAFTGSSTLNIRVTGSGAVAGVDYDQLISHNFYGGQASTVSGLANATLHVTIPTGLSLLNDVETIVLSAYGAGTAGTVQNFTGAAFGKIVFDNYAIADVHYNNGSITLSRLATAGDITRNGYVDGSDLNVLLANWSHTGATHDQGDASGDGVVNGSDLNILLSNWNVGVNGQGVDAVGGVVPEPMTLTLLGLGAIGLLRRKNRN
jgi:hypothetical protein